MRWSIGDIQPHRLPTPCHPVPPLSCRSSPACAHILPPHLLCHLCYRTLPAVPSGFFIGLVYCIINPIIAPTVLLFFLVVILTQRYNSLYVYKTLYESGGRLWGVTFSHFMVGVYAMQVRSIM